MSDGLSQSDLDALFAGSGDTGTAEAEKKKADVKQEMSDGLSQSDLDALFAGFGDTGTAEPDGKKAGADAKQELSDGLSQSDLDALFAGFDTGPAPPAAETKSAPAIDMSPAWETPPEASEDKGEVLSQDDIDKLLAMYGS